MGGETEGILHSNVDFDCGGAKADAVNWVQVWLCGEEYLNKKHHAIYADRRNPNRN
jgi:hypothetical protein